MSRRPLKKLEESDDDAAPAMDEDALMASLSGFLVPDAFSSLGASQQHTQPVADHMDDEDDAQREDHNDGFDPVSKPSRDHEGGSRGAAAAAAASASKDGKQAPAKRKRKRKGDPTDPATAAEASAERAAQAQAAVEGDAAAAAHRAAVAKARQLRREQPSTARIRHVASTGLVHATLPLLSALVRERLLENSLPSAARALAQLYPAFRLDIQTICNCSIEIMDKHTQQQQTQPAQHHHQGQQAHNNQITRFYKKIINLHPKNLVQVVFELALQFLRHGASQECYDHLATWSVSPYLASTASRSSALLQGYLGVIAWECARQAGEEGARWAVLLQRREDGDDEGLDPRAASYPSSSQTSTNDLRLEVRTCAQKQLSFEKLARSKLRAAVNADRANGLWLFYYLECMQQFYQQTLQHEATQQHASSSAAAAASFSSAAKTRVQLDEAKLVHLQQRLIRKIDDFIVADASSSASAGQCAASGFAMRLHYLHLFTPHARSTLDRQHAWITVAHLLAADPLSNLGIAHAWRMWEEQGQRDASSPSESRWCLRSADLIDLFAARLDSYPMEEWSWHAMLRLMATHLCIDADSSALWRWTFRGVLEPAAVDAPHAQSPRVAPASPASSFAAAASPLHRSVSLASAASSRRGGPSGKVSGSDSDSASPSPVKKPRTDEKRMIAAADAENDESSASSTPRMHAQSSSPVSHAASQGSGSTSGGRPPRSFPHMQLASLPQLTDAERKSSLWLGRIEWWVQATGHWRDVEHISPHDAPSALPEDKDARLLLLRGLCYWMALHWMGWIAE